MKMYKRFIVLSLMLAQFACQPQTTSKSSSKKPVETDSAPVNTTPLLSEDPPAPIRYEYYFVSARSGVNYHQSPKGKVLGQLSLNTPVKVFRHSGVFETVTEKGATGEGEWLAIEQGADTAYVLSIFLSSNYTFADLNIYTASAFYKTDDETRQAFVNLSEKYPWNYEDDSLTIIRKTDFGKDTIKLNSDSKELFLKKMKISPNDTVFLYNINVDSILKFPVAKLPVIAPVNIYSQGDENIQEYNYEIGFNLGRKYTLEGETFAYVGTHNPFQIGKVRSILWKSMDSSTVVKVFSREFIPVDVKKKFRNAEPDDIYTSSYKEYDYFIKARRNYDNIALPSYLLVINTATNEIVFNDFFTDSESTYLIPLQIQGDKREYGKQWTGAIFKNKPPIIFGFMGNSFGCPSIRFLDKKEPPIYLLCDNRH